MEINKALSDKFGPKYLKSCIEQEIQKAAKRDAVFIADKKGLQAADNTGLSEQEVEKQNSQTFLNGCRKYNLSLTICWKNSLPPKAKWLKTIIAFANGAGGELILGVDDKNRDIVSGVRLGFCI